MDIDARLSANLGFLWTDLDLLSAITAAATAGFSAVEFHQPFETPPDQVASALGEHGMTLVSLNTGVGNAAAGELGLAAVPGREREARALIDEAVDYAGLTNAAFVSVVAGITGRSTEAELTYRRNLTYACERAAVADCRVLIEPLNTSAVPDYHLVDLEAGVATIEAVESDRLSLMADTFHVLTMTGSLDGVASALDHIGHIQFSGWPDRGEPDRGFDAVETLAGWSDAGYRGNFGAEYQPRTTTDEGMAWRSDFVRRWRSRDDANPDELSTKDQA